MRLTPSFLFFSIVSAILLLPSQVLLEAKGQQLAQYLDDEMDYPRKKKNEPQDTNKSLKKYKNYELYKLTNSKFDPDSQVFFDGFDVKTHKPYESGGSESRFAAITAKWSNRFVSLQPYTYGCFLGCYKFDYANPPQELKVAISGDTYKIKKVDIDSLKYYLPLDLRKGINEGASDVTISGFDQKITYTLNENALSLLRSLLDTTVELDEFLVIDECQPSKREKLLELESLLKDKLIKQDEYELLRIRALGLAN